MIILKYLNIFCYIVIPCIFIYLVTNLNSSVASLSLVLLTFFKSLFPYLFIFLITNHILIKTKLILIFGYILQWLFYPIFKVNAKSCSLIILSLISGFPSSVLYSSLLIKDNKESESLKMIGSLFFLPSFSFVFYLIKTSLSFKYFLPFTIALYTPTFICMFLKRYKFSDEFITIRQLKMEVKSSFMQFHYINDLKQIFVTSILTLVNILGMITFYSLFNLLIPDIFIKGLFEFSMPSIAILNYSIVPAIKCMLLLIILIFSSFSSISQALIYLEDLEITPLEFIKTRIVLLSLSLLIFTFLFYFI